MSETSSPLIECTACHKPMGRLAVSCPACGTPNLWTHPKIKALEAGHVVGVTKPYTFTYSGASLSGEAKYLTVWAWACLALFFVFASVSFIFFSIWVVLACGIALGLAKHFAQTHKTFSANILTGEWTSNDDIFWQPLRVYLHAPVTDAAA